MTFLIVLAYLAALIPIIWVRRKPKLTISCTIAIMLLLTAGLYLANFYVDFLLYQSLGLGSVFWGRLAAVLSLFFGLGLFSFLLVGINIWLLKRALKPLLTGKYDSLVFNSVAYPIAFIIALITGAIAAGKWTSFLLYFNQVKSGITDPVFHQNLSFYLFSLPIQDYLSTLVIVIMIIAGVAFGITYGIYFYVSEDKGDKDAKKFKEGCVSHVSLWGAMFFSAVGWKFFLANYHLLYNSGGLFFGAGYTDIHALVPANYVMIFICAAIIIAMFINVGLRKWRIQIASLSIFFVVWLIAGAISPAIMQYWVEKNELDKESTYISYHIESTRQAYGLEKMEEKEFPYQSNVSPELFARNQDTFENIRIWDWRPLGSSYEQRQSLRKYYSFSDIDIDRYYINGKYRQVMLATRELEKTKLDSSVQESWVNARLKYTHGYGVALNQVNEFGLNGVPNFLVKDIPPQSSVPEIKITRPEIYFGLLTRDHVIVNTTEKEFDYPHGDENVFSTYQGTGGVEIGTGLRKLALAIRFDGLSLYASGYIKPESRILFCRQVEERLKTIAPFFKYDKDSYSVIGDAGGLWRIADAYTTSHSYPYSQPYNGEINYIRNSVKAVTNDYNGSVDFYVFDENDPIIKTWQKIFPALLKSKDAMPKDLLAHIRYPEDLLYIQGKIYCTYHMTDTQVFYNKEDVWRIADEKHAMAARQEVIPYYVISRLPNEKNEEFIQILPFTPQSQDKDNLVGWLAGRSDGENYGKLLGIKFPKQQLVYGPMQFEARIEQTDEILRLFGIWIQTSEIIRGNTLVIPIEDTVLYVEPVYLKAKDSEMPEIKRVIVAIGDRLEWGNTVDEALKNISSDLVVTPVPPLKQEFQSSEIVPMEEEVIQQIDRIGRLWTDYQQQMEKEIEKLKGLTK